MNIIEWYNRWRKKNFPASKRDISWRADEIRSEILLSSKQIVSAIENAAARQINNLDKSHEFICLNILGKYVQDTHDILHTATLVAGLETATYYTSKMLAVTNFGDNLALLAHAMLMRHGVGLILEFGVASGRTINHLASLTSQKVYGFDVFTGLPEDWRTGFHKGMFAQSIPDVRENVELIVGLFEDTIPMFLETAPKDPISLLHIDCDLYSSTKTVFKHLSERIVPGTVIVFDEYFNYPGWQQHEFKAFQEFIRDSGLKYSYNSFVSRHQQVCVIINE